MLWVPQKGIIRMDQNTGSVGSATPGTAVTTGGTAATKGTPAQLIASTAFDAYWIWVWASQYGLSANACRCALDILIGAATEEVLIPNLLAGGAGTVGTSGGRMWGFPLYIAAGSRISAQAAGDRTSTAIQVGVFLQGGSGYPPFRVGSKVTTYGMGTVPGGTNMSSQGASGAEGAYVEIVASTTENHFAFLPDLQLTGSSGQGRLISLDIGIGAATETAIGPWWMHQTGTEMMDLLMPPVPLFRDVPSGTRLALRNSWSGTTVGTDAVIHAVS